jgi:hypothetical protein
MPLRTSRSQSGFRVMLLMFVSGSAYAGVDDLPFELRLFLAVDRQSNYSSTLARQASIGALDGASANPAAAAYREVSERTTTMTASAVYAPSTHGGSIGAFPVSLRWQAPDVGTIALAYAHTDTYHANGDDGLVHSLRSDEWIGGYGRRIADNASAGFTVRLTNGTIVSDSHADALGGLPVRTETRFLAPDVSLGIAAQMTPILSVGMAGGYSAAHAHSTVTNLVPLPIAVAPGVPFVLPPGSVLETPSDIVSVGAIRAGVGFKIREESAVYFDIMGLRLSTHHSGSADLARFALGTDWRCDNGWTLRAGVSTDSLGNVNWSGGFDYRFAAFDAQLAIQTNAAPELNREIGRTRLVSASLGWRF